MEKKSFPEGQIMGMWMGIIMLVVTILVALICILTDSNDFIAFGPAIGVSIGLSVGIAMEAKYKKEGRIIPQSAQMKRRNRTIMLIGVMVLVVMVLTTIIVFLF